MITVTTTMTLSRISSRARLMTSATAPTAPQPSRLQQGGLRRRRPRRRLRFRFRPALPLSASPPVPAASCAAHVADHACAGSEKSTAEDLEAEGDVVAHGGWDGVGGCHGEEQE